jgi:predicted nuclease of predicted toxin-antitoxin system
MRGTNDEVIFGLAREKQALLITRDIHFTNSVRFPPSQAGGILYLTQGNLRSSEEAKLVTSFLQSHTAEIFEGRLTFLSPAYVSIR